MKISRKCQYALKAIFELAWRNEGKPVKTHDIATAQRMSLRFTEIILNELKHGGFVESRRGNEGGYILAREPKELTVREVIEFVQGPISGVPDKIRAVEKISRFGNMAFTELWQEVDNAVCTVLNGRTFADLVQLEAAKRDAQVPDYAI